MHLKVRLRWWLVLGLSAAICVYYGSIQIREQRVSSALPWWHWKSAMEGSVSEVILPLHNVSKEVEIKHDNTTKIFMYNNPPFGQIHDHILDEDRCGGKCLVTYDTSYRSVADAVIYHCIELDPWTSMLQRSRSSQLFVFFCMENPWTTLYTRDRTKAFSNFDGIFNLTMTYRTDSDYYEPYGNTADVLKAVNNDPAQKDFDTFLKQKTKLSVWIVSNCHYTKGAYHRMQMVEQLRSAGLEIDLFGKCFKKLDKKQNQLEIISKYKFHLSFENALHCRNYITEKVWNNALRAGTVPVVWGPSKKDAARLLPEGSYIMVEDFRTPDDLVRYLEYLNSDDEAYRKYFEWRNKPAPESMNRLGLCALCHSLHSDKFSKSTKVLKSLHKWWYEEESNVCIAPWDNAEWSRYRIEHFFMRNTRYIVLFFAALALIVISILATYRSKH